MWLNHSLPYILRSHNTNEPSASFERVSVQFFAAVQSSCVSDSFPFSFLIFFKSFCSIFSISSQGHHIIILFNTNVRWINWYVFTHNRIKYILLSSLSLCRFCCPPAGGSSSTEIHLNISETYKKTQTCCPYYLLLFYLEIFYIRAVFICCLRKDLIQFEASQMSASGWPEAWVKAG